MQAHHYAHALIRAQRGKTSKEQEKITTQFLSRLRDRGHIKLLPQIAAHIQKLSRARSDETLVVARKKDVVRARKEAGTKVGATINPDLIGGWQHTKEGVLTDTSYKRSLIELYRTITK